MQSPPRASLRSPFLACLAAGLLLGAPALAAEEEVDDFLDEDSVGRVEIQAVSAKGTEILADISAARAAIEANDYEKARFETAKARALLEEVRYKSPAVRLQDKITRALGLARESKATTNDLQPIFAELDAVKSVDEMADVREQVELARGHVVAGSQAEAADALVMASSRIRYLEMDLPIQETLNRVHRAAYQLSRKDPLAASASLAEAASHTETFVAMASRSEMDEMSVGAGPP